MSFVGKPGFSAPLNVGLAQSLGVKHLYMFDEAGGYVRDLIGQDSIAGGTGVTVKAGLEGTEYSVAGSSAANIASFTLPGSGVANTVVIARILANATQSSPCGMAFGL